MKKIFLPFAAVALLLSSCKDATPKEELVINLQEKGAEVAPSIDRKSTRLNSSH